MIEIVAHRGASHDAPENTLAAFSLACQQNADAVELDIHLSADGRIVVIHDHDTRRVGAVDRLVAEQTLDELRAINVADFGSWKGRGWVETIPTLEEVLALAPAGTRLFIEIKVRRGILPALEEAFRRAQTPVDQTVIITFFADVAATAKQTFPDRQVFWLVEHATDPATGQYPTLHDLVLNAQRLGVDGMNLEHHFPLNEAAVNKVHAAGLKLYVWTLDDPIRARALSKAGVDGITTNRPGALRREIAAVL